MNLKITTLIENMPAADTHLQNEHGLSLFIEFDGEKILFDTGQTNAFLDNAKTLGVAVEEADKMVISHGHYDHSGGVMKMLERLNPKAPMYVGDGYFDPKYKILEDGSYSYNGIAFTENDVTAKHEKLVKVTDDVTVLSGNILLFKNFPYQNDFEKRNPKFFVKKDEDMVPDHFTDEVALGLVTMKGLVIVAGCSHVGIVNILTSIQERTHMPIYAVLGGTHLVNAEKSRIEKTIQAFGDMDIQCIALSHCTGEEGIQMIRDQWQGKFVLNNTGNVFEM